MNNSLKLKIGIWIVRKTMMSYIIRKSDGFTAYDVKRVPYYRIKGDSGKRGVGISHGRYIALQEGALKINSLTKEEKDFLNTYFGELEQAYRLWRIITNRKCYQFINKKPAK